MSVTLTNFKPESPFLSESYGGSPEPEADPIRSNFTAAFVQESPFLTSFDTEAAMDPETALLASMAMEFYDRDFEDTLGRFAQEVFEAVVHEADLRGLGRASENEVEAVGRELFLPTIREVEAALDRMIAEAGNLDASTLSETEIDEVFARYEPVARSNVQFAYFLDGLWKKAKKVVGTVAKVAKQAVQTGVRMVGKILPLKQILGVLKKMVAPLVNRVLRYAIDKLPPAIQPIAKKLAAMLPGMAQRAGAQPRRVHATATSSSTPAAAAVSSDPNATPADEPGTPEGTPTAPNPEEIQQQFDLMVASSLVNEDLQEAEFNFEDESWFGDTRMTSVRELDTAREELARAATTLQPGESLAPQIQNFIPLVLAAAPMIIPAVRTAIGIIGRERVVNFIADMVATLVQKYVGKEAATALSRAVVDTGLGLIGLETSPESASRAAGFAVAQTVEDTVRGLGEAVERYQLEGADLENPVILEALTLEAFEAAAAANFPPQLLRPESREAGTSNGTWVMLPQTGIKRYKKYTEVLEITIDPKGAEGIKTFGGTSLAGFLYEQLGVAKGPVRARMHLYEAIPGTWLSRISLYERNVPGLGSAYERAWSQIHPLSVQAASVLAQRPGLGRDVSTRYLQSRHRIGVGQRFYYLEVAGHVRRPLPLPPMRPGAPGTPWTPTPTVPGPVPTPIPVPQPSDHASQINLTVDCPKNEIRVSLYTSEAVSQQIATSLRQNSPMSMVLRIYLGMGATISNTLAEGPMKHVRLIREMEQFALAPLAREALKRLWPLLVEALRIAVPKFIGEYLQRKAAEFKTAFLEAAENPAMGVSVILTFKNPPGLSVLCQVLNGQLPSLPSFSQVLPSPDISIRPGLIRD